MRKYYSGITMFKLVGSILVLAVHAFLLQFILEIPNQSLKFIGLLCRLVIPCFYVVSGFLAYKGWMHAQNSRLYIRRYLKRIIGIYLVFCLLYIFQKGIPQIAREGLSYNSFISQLKQFIAAVIMGVKYHLWFIPPLIFSIGVVYWLCERKQVPLLYAAAVTGFFVSQFMLGPLNGTFNKILQAYPFLSNNIFDYLTKCIPNYFGFGLTFVTTGVFIARHEERFMNCKVWIFLIPSLLITTTELQIYLHSATWNGEYVLAFCFFSNTLLLIYGILHIEISGIKRYNKIINLFSVITYFAHVPLMEINESVLRWKESEMGIYIFLITLVQCTVLTLLAMSKIPALAIMKKAFVKVKLLRIN